MKTDTASAREVFAFGESFIPTLRFRADASRGQAGHRSLHLPEANGAAFLKKGTLLNIAAATRLCRH